MKNVMFIINNNLSNELSNEKEKKKIDLTLFCSFFPSLQSPLTSISKGTFDLKTNELWMFHSVT